MSVVSSALAVIFIIKFTRFEKNHWIKKFASKFVVLLELS